MTQKRVMTLEPVGGEPDVGRWLAAMQDARTDTVRELAQVSDADLDQTPDPLLNSIGSLLYHIALIEADWLIDDIFADPSLWPKDQFPAADRSADGRLSVVTGETLLQHLERLRVVRALLVEKMREMSSEDFHRARSRASYDVSPAWVLHHLLQHEAEHRAHIAYVRDSLARTP